MCYACDCTALKRQDRENLPRSTEKWEHASRGVEVNKYRKEDTTVCKGKHNGENKRPQPQREDKPYIFKKRTQTSYQSTQSHHCDLGICTTACLPPRADQKRHLPQRLSSPPAGVCTCRHVHDSSPSSRGKRTVIPKMFPNLSFNQIHSKSVNLLIKSKRKPTSVLQSVFSAPLGANRRVDRVV